ncbi:helix-turn-helix domain-containing GNAT family N-acetyltransferase [Clostridioides difficile]|nr:helix-turn-helix domain-containing GNAT family N-acetyltransferase [Clostridioides difficile]
MNEIVKEDINIIRRFNRFYTNILGLLDRHILESKLSLSQVRILHEIETIPNCTSTLLTEKLCIDSGYISRILNQFQKQGLIQKQKSKEDGRSNFLVLTETGEQKLAEMNARSDKQIYQMIQPLSKYAQHKLIQDMAFIERILTKDKPINSKEISIRHQIKPGDAGYITYMHGWIYKQEYNYSTAFESYVAQSFYEFLQNYNPELDRLWIAEHNAEIIGCIGIVNHGNRAQLRWFLLHPDYRGIGLGKSLLNAALDYCHQKKYKSVYLDTTDDLETAIAMYKSMGFIKVTEKENRSWREDLTELEFEMQL